MSAESIGSTCPVVPEVTRPIFRLDQINQSCGYVNHQESIRQKVAGRFNEFKCRRGFRSVFPFLAWTRRYSVRRDLPLDIISGCTVAIMHIPQGMGYALLANMPPIMGIYTAFFPVLAFFLFGTSRHNSMGTFAVISIMVGKVVLAKSQFQHIGPDGEFLDEAAANLPTALELVSALCCLIGILQCLMFCCRMGVMATLLSDSLVSGFTTGAAVHVFTSQVKDLLGITLPKFPGNFDVLYTYFEIVKNLGQVNWIALLLSVFTCTVLILNNDVLKPRVAKLTIVPVPMELILVITGTLASRYLNLASVDTIKTIPTGFPSPVAPSFGLMSNLLTDAFVIAVVSYSVTVSMALIFAKKENYKINFNQELLAMGAGNLLGSVFQCIPFAASLSRSVIQHSVGGKTQIASLVSCGILVFILLWIGPFFEALPKAVLAGIIVVSLKGLLWQLRDLKQYWKASKIDGLIWAITFTVVVAVAIDVGLMVGIALSLLSLVIRGQQPYICLLGNVPGTEIYLDIRKYKKAHEIEGMKIFHFSGCLNFASREKFKDTLYWMVNFNPVATDDLDEEHPTRFYSDDVVESVILDLSCVTYVDASGAETMHSAVKEMKSSNIEVLVVTASSLVFEELKNGDSIEQYSLFPTIHDAVRFASQRDHLSNVMYEAL